MHFKPTPYFKDDPIDTPVSYQFCSPARVAIRQLDGTVTAVGFGIGEFIDILEPSLQSLACRHDPYEEIPLADGTHIVEFGHLDLRRINREKDAST